MNFSHFDQTNIALYGNGVFGGINTPVPNELKINLLSKRVGVEEIKLTTKGFPRFIPLYSTEETRNYTAGSASDTFIQKNVLSVNQINYFMNIRKRDNSQCVTAFVLWENLNFLIPPQLSIIDNNSVWLLPYFYCYNFTDFLRMVNKALVDGVVQANGGIPNDLPYFTFDAESKTFNLSMPSALVDLFTFEFSKDLMDLFGFQNGIITKGYSGSTSNIIPTYEIIWSDLVLDINTVNYLNSSATVQNIIFPFDLFVLETSLPINKFTFTDSASRNIENALTTKALRVWTKDFNAMNFDKEVVIPTPDSIDRLKYFTKNEFSDNYVTFRLFMRVRRNQQFIEFPISPQDTFSFTLNTYTIFTV